MTDRTGVPVETWTKYGRLYPTQKGEEPYIKGFISKYIDKNTNMRYNSLRLLTKVENNIWIYWDSFA